MFRSYGSGFGQLNCPLLSEIDDEGNILIAGNENNRIDILNNDGSFESLNIPGLKENPTYVRVLDNKIFVQPSNNPMQVFNIKFEPAM